MAVSLQVVIEVFAEWTPKDIFEEIDLKKSQLQVVAREVFGEGIALAHGPKFSGGKIWAVASVPRAKFSDVLAKSGSKGIFVRPFLAKGAENENQVVFIGKEKTWLNP